MTTKRREKEVRHGIDIALRFILHILKHTKLLSKADISGTLYSTIWKDYI